MRQQQLPFRNWGHQPKVAGWRAGEGGRPVDFRGKFFGRPFIFVCRILAAASWSPRLVSCHHHHIMCNGFVCVIERPCLFFGDPLPLALPHSAAHWERNWWKLRFCGKGWYKIRSNVAKCLTNVVHIHITRICSTRWYKDSSHLSRPKSSYVEFVSDILGAFGWSERWYSQVVCLFGSIQPQPG